MKRVGNADTISEIEFVIGASSVGDLRQSWTAFGVDCTRERHRYVGHSYAFSIDVLDLRRAKAGRLLWRVLIITEWWHVADVKDAIRNTKWLKVLNGRAPDVKAWVRTCRSQKLDRSAASHVPEP